MNLKSKKYVILFTWLSLGLIGAQASSQEKQASTSTVILLKNEVIYQRGVSYVSEDCMEQKEDWTWFKFCYQYGEKVYIHNQSTNLPRIALTHHEDCVTKPGYDYSRERVQQLCFEKKKSVELKCLQDSKLAGEPCEVVKALNENKEDKSFLDKIFSSN